MRKNVLIFPFSAFCLLLLCNILCLPSLKAQDCVDFDKARYPIIVEGVSHEWNPIWNFTNIKQRRVTGLSIYNNNFRGLLEHLPSSYNQQGNSLKKYPVIIFFHGFGSRGTG